VCVPVHFGLLNSQEEQHFPLGLLNSGLQITFDLQGDLNQAIYANNAGGITSITYSVDNVSFNYESIKVPVEHFQSLRLQMATDGSLYQLPYYSAMNMSIGALATTDMTFGVGLSSLKGVFTALKPASTYGTQYLSQRYGLTQWRALLDGQLVNQYSLPAISTSGNSEVEFFIELNRALGGLGNTSRTSGPASFAPASYTALAGANAGTSPYGVKFFWTGLCTNKFSENHLTYTGSSVSQLQIHGETISANAITMYIVLIYDGCLFIDSAGNCSINK
jgi:hypothetical protein